jgi:hypothetical protein
MYRWGTFIRNAQNLSILQSEDYKYFTSLTPPRFTEVYVPSHESERSCICTLGISILPLFTILNLLSTSNVIFICPHIYMFMANIYSMNFSIHHVPPTWEVITYPRYWINNIKLLYCFALYFNTLFISTSYTHIWVKGYSQWMRWSCLMPTRQFVSYIMALTFMAWYINFSKPWWG